MKLPPLDHEDYIEAEREYCSRSLSNYVKKAWVQVEPAQRFAHGWALDCVAEHLQAVTYKEINRLYIAIPPGCCKSLLSAVFWPSWEWGPAQMSHYRILATSHKSDLAIRDNIKMRRLITTDWYKRLWGDVVHLTGDQNAKTKFENTSTGFREAMAFTGLTGSRGDRVILDDVMSVDDAASDPTRESIIRTFLEAVPTRLNNPEWSAIVVIQQRLHVRDIIGVIESEGLGYEGLVLPMEFDPDRRCKTSIGFIDPRKERGELLFPERFPRDVVERDKKVLGRYAASSQLDQLPIPREGGMFKEEWFKYIDAAPADTIWVRGWDLAATESSISNKAPPYTAGVLVGYSRSTDSYYIKDVKRGQWSPASVEKNMKSTAKADGTGVVIDIPQDPGQAGKSQIRYLVKALKGFTVKWSVESGSKVQRAEPVASQIEVGNVQLVNGTWNRDFINEVILFPNGVFKDQVDAMSRAFSRIFTMVDDIYDDEFGAPIEVRA